LLALLILPILVSGYIAVKLDPVISRKLFRLEGQKLYMEIAKHGMINFFITMFFILFTFVGSLLDVTQNQLASLISGKSGSELSAQAAFVITLSFSTFLVAYANGAIKLGMYWYRRRYDIDQERWQKVQARVQKAFRRGGIRVGYVFGRKEFEKLDEPFRKLVELENLREAVDGSPLDTFLLELFLTESLLQVTLKNDKAYVGVVIAIGEYEEGEAFKEIALLPIISGYRDKDKRQLYFPNVYPWVSGKQTNLEAEDTSLGAIYIPKSEIHSFSGFSFDVYNHVSSEEQLKLDV